RAAFSPARGRPLDARYGPSQIPLGSLWNLASAATAGRNLRGLQPRGLRGLEPRGVSDSTSGKRSGPHALRTVEKRAPRALAFVRPAQGSRARPSVGFD